MKKVFVYAILLAIVFQGALTSATAQSASLKDFPKGKSPKAIGKLLAKRFIAAPHGNFGNGRIPKTIIYPETCTWFGSLEFADNIHNKKMIKQLQARLDHLIKDEHAMIPPASNVDNSVFGIVPLETYELTGKQAYLELGKSFADRQWTMPATEKPHYRELLDKGLSWQTRLWIDDMFMITELEVQTYRATKDEKYIDRAADEMVVYLDSLQRPNGLFYHAPDSPFFWGRGNGWVAVGMTEVLRYLPKTNQHYDHIMEGYKKMMAALKQCQDSKGMWHQLIDNPDAWAETSSTGMFTYAMITGVKKDWLDDSYAAVARQGWLGLLSYINKDGAVANVCEGTNKGHSKQYYLDRKRITGDMHGQAPVLWCAYALTEK